MTYPVAPHNVIDVVAVYSSTRADAYTKTEFNVRNEASPFVVLDAPAKSVTVHKASSYVCQMMRLDRIEYDEMVWYLHRILEGFEREYTISPKVIQFTTTITFDVYLSKSDLHMTKCALGP